MSELNKAEKIVAAGLICVVVGVIGGGATNRLIFVLLFFIGILLFIVAGKIKKRQLKLAGPLLKGKLFVKSYINFNIPLSHDFRKRLEAAEYLALFNPLIRADTEDSADTVIDLFWDSQLAIGQGYGKSHEFGLAGYYFCNVIVTEKSIGRELMSKKVQCSSPPKAISWGGARPAPDKTNTEYGYLDVKPVKDYLLSLLQEKDVSI